MTDLAQCAADSVVILHQQIEALFHGDDSRLAELQTHFADDFEMVTPGGKKLALAEVNALFAALAGARKGMTITIERCRIVAQFGTEVAIQYHEVQQQQDKRSERISLAVIDCAAQPPRWRYLQETLLP